MECQSSRIRAQKTTEWQKSGRAPPWSVADGPRDYIEAQKKAIVGIEIKIAVLEGKWKVSQNQPEANRRSVAAGFSMDEVTRKMAKLVRITASSNSV